MIALVSDSELSKHDSWTHHAAYFSQSIESYNNGLLKNSTYPSNNVFYRGAAVQEDFDRVEQWPIISSAMSISVSIEYNISVLQHCALYIACFNVVILCVVMLRLF